MKNEFNDRFMVSEDTEKYLKNGSLFLGILSAIAVVFDLYPLTMFLSLPFCVIWVYCGWLRSEPQLKWINIVFLVVYGSGIAGYLWLHAISGCIEDMSMGDNGSDEKCDHQTCYRR